MHTLKKFLVSSVLLPVLFASLPDRHGSVASATNRTVCSSVHVGVIVNLRTTAGKRIQASMLTAIDEFYKLHDNLSTKVALQFRNSSEDVLGAISTAVDLSTNWDVQAIIIGPMNPDQAHVIASLGNRVQIPIISLAAQPIPIASFPFLIHANLDEYSTQAVSIAALAKHFGWRHIVPIFEDSGYNVRMVSIFLSTLQSKGVAIPIHVVIPSNANDTLIETELLKLRDMQAKIFVTCMMPVLASRLYQHATHVGLMREGYAWIATSSLASVIETHGQEVIDTMQGLIGIRPYIPKSSNTTHFITKFSAKFRKENPEIFEPSYPMIHDLLAYDTTWVIATAAEKSHTLCLEKRKSRNWSSNSDSQLVVSLNGQELLDAIQTTNFDNMGIKYQLVDWQLQFSSFEIVNVAGGVRVRGSWSPNFGLRSPNRTNYLKNDLRPIIWPGDTVELPQSWPIKTTGRKLKIALPCKSPKLTDCITEDKIIGFCKDVFDSAIQKLPVEPDYIAFTNWTSFNSIIERVSNGEFDAFVGDITILSNRTMLVDFTQPFTDPGIAMVVSTKKVYKTWRFLEPLDADLWFASLGFFVFTGFVLWAIEHQINPEFRGPPSQQASNVLYFIFSTLFFSHKQNLHSNLSRFAIIIWLFVVLVLTTSYTASFSTMLTVEQLRATSTDVQELIQGGDYVGYATGSPVVGNALKRIGFSEFKLRDYAPAQYATALTKGNANGGAAAIFDEIPYVKVFISNHCDDKYTMFAVKPSLSYTIGIGGFGFAFQKNSPLTLDVSRRILELKESDEMTKIEMKWFPNSAICQDKGQQDPSGTSISFRSFAGLFIVTGLASGLMLFTHLGIFTLKEWNNLKLVCSNLNSPWQQVCGCIQHFDKKDLNSSAFKSDNSNNQGSLQHPEAHINGMDTENATSAELVITADHMPTSPSSEQPEAMPAHTETEMANT